MLEVYSYIIFKIRNCTSKKLGHILLSKRRSSVILEISDGFFFWFFKKEILFEVCINKANLGSFKINVMHFLPKKKIWFPQELSTILKRIFFFNFLKKCILLQYMYIFFFYFQLFVVKWTDDEDIFFEPFTYLETPLLRVHFGHARVPFGHALGHQQSSILKICKSIMPFLKKIRNLTKNLPDIQNLTKTNKKSLQQQEQTFSRLIIIPPQSNWQLISRKKFFFVKLKFLFTLSKPIIIIGLCVKICSHSFLSSFKK